MAKDGSLYLVGDGATEAYKVSRGLFLTPVSLDMHIPLSQPPVGLLEEKKRSSLCKSVAIRYCSFL